jgi:hypothetical protein
LKPLDFFSKRQILLSPSLRVHRRSRIPESHGPQEESVLEQWNQIASDEGSAYERMLEQVENHKGHTSALVGTTPDISGMTQSDFNNNVQSIRQEAGKRINGFLAKLRNGATFGASNAFMPAAGALPP